MSENKIIIYGANWCPDTLVSLMTLDKHHLDYEKRFIDDNPEYIKTVEELNSGMRIIPTIIFPNGTTLSEPSEPELEKFIERLHEDSAS